MALDDVGFIGLGAMGFPMAANLLQKLPKTSRIFVYDVSSESMVRLLTLGSDRVVICKNCKEVADQAHVIISIVPEGKHVRSVYLTPETGVLAADLKSKIIIDCSTIDTESSIQVAAELAKIHPNCSFYDAPVSGGVLGAERGTLTIMLGCALTDTNYPSLEKLLSMMGTTIVPCGKPSLGLVAKLCNNYCSGLIAIATAEAMDIAIRSGLDPRILAQIFSTSTAQSTIADKFCPVPGIVPTAPSTNGYKGGFKVQLMKKDFDLACQAAEAVGSKLMLAKAGQETYTGAANDPRCKDLDNRVVFRYIGGDESWKSKFDN